MQDSHTLIIIFGITGDLASRKLLPALANIAAAGRLKNISVLGVSRRNMSLQNLFSDLFSNESTTGDDHTRELLLATDMLQMDISETSEYEKISAYIVQKQVSIGADKPLQILYYLSVPPSAALPIIEMLGRNNLSGPHTKLLLEKPFGFDLQSAEEAITKTAAHFDESQVYRIDHYLAKEMAQNIVVFRATNPIFSNLWSRECIDAIDIIASETIDIEGRAQFYEQTGALRDIIQSHVLQLMALVLAETPNTLDWQVMPQLRAMALSQITPPTIDMPGQTAVRAQYEGYKTEVGSTSTTTETFAAITLFSQDPLWENVPIRLITGKALSKKTTEIRIHFKKKQSFASNTLTLHIQPTEGVTIDLWSKRPGYERDFIKNDLTFSYDQTETNLPDAYEQVIIDAINSNKSLFASSEEILLAWKILAPIQSYWNTHTADLRTYKKGSTFASVIKREEQ